jgi:cobyrinic acid a,c-diamide synthase
MLHEAIASTCKTRILGWLPRDPAIAIPERHLGLQSAAEESASTQDDAVDRLAVLAEKYLDLDELLTLQCGMEMAGLEPSRSSFFLSGNALRVGVASDEAFSFYYEDNLDLLREQGVEIIRFSPLHDAALPHDLDALYFGGGYPELHAQRLSGNHQMLKQVRAFATSGRPVYAECGGMIYLARILSVSNGITYPMASVVPISMEMTEKLVKFGYVTVELVEDCLLGPKGTVVRGHSFHYSRIAAQEQLETSYRVHYSMAGEEEFEGFRRGSVLASYIHLHFRANPVVAESFVAAIRRAQALQAVTA